ncbi:ufm1-specific protease 2-like [Mizuhopecten yessoensis]|uniref:ufm1-specific protease 2-like n=1 Tax=Mizuhopecten yessoensis TaxID=6573 RepID=UPI000B45D335|nr:ufm1-specific protease 2-like [Mizuhopecten yessoensis]
MPEVERTLSMAKKVVVHHEALSVLSNICSSKQKTQGCLLGYRNSSNYEVVACAKCQDGWNTNDIKQYLPGGIYIIGVFYSNAVATDTSSIVRDLGSFGLEKILVEGEDLVVCPIGIECDTVAEENFYLWTDGQTLTIPTVSISRDCSLDSLLTIRIKCPIPLSFELVTKADIWKANLQKEIHELCNASQSRSVLYHLKDSDILVGSDQLCGLSRDSSCSDLHSHIKTGDGFGEGGRKSKKEQLSTLQFSMYHQINKKSSFHAVPSCCPVIKHSLGNYKSVEMTLPVDAVAVVSRDLPVTDLHTVLSTAVCHQLTAMAACIIKDTVAKSEKFSKPVPYHFQPGGLQAIFSVVYLQNMTEEQLVQRRTEVHRMLGLPENQPLFRRCNAVMFHEDRSSYGYLINPHTGISSQGVKGGTQYLVDGLYSYHHYMQDRFDDNKWGCAYRSLQTLMSWFKLQGYTEKPVASHKEVQQALVDVGDKDPKFVGSRQWIGSMEVSYCLDHLLGVTSKIMFVSTGAELTTKGRELALHFQTQGTPIMIGGGVLAHTILGVDFNDVTGDLKFLILDPHYTGAEDLKVILDKGWCGWKGPDFWDQHAHYNLCMPQRPLAI